MGVETYKYYNSVLLLDMLENWCYTTTCTVGAKEILTLLKRRKYLRLNRI